MYVLSHATSGTQTNTSRCLKLSRAPSMTTVAYGLAEKLEGVEDLTS